MCPIGFLMLGSPCKTCRAIRPPHADQPAAGGEPRRAPAPTNERSWRAPGLSWSATRSSWPLPNHLPRRRPGPNRRLGWPSTACASFERQAPTQADDEPGMDAAGDHADPGQPQPYGCLPHAALQDLTSAGHSGRGNAQTPDAHTARRTADAGQRTPGRSDAHTGHWTPVPWTGKRGHWSLTLDTGHWTPDAGRGRGQGDEGTAGIRTSWPPRRATAGWDAQPCSCGRRLRRSTAHAGSAVRPPSSAR